MNILYKFDLGRRTTVFSLVVLLMCVGFSGKATATFLAPGGTVVPNSAAPPAGATVLANTGPESFTSNTGLVSGTALSAVLRDPSNVFGANDLDFVYQVMNSANSIDAIGRLTAINFTGFLTDVSFTTTGAAVPGGFVNGSVPPNTADRSLGGDTVGFNFAANSFLPGTTSFLLIIQTNATLFQPGTLNIIDGGIASVPAFAPNAPAVPDGGTTLMLLGSALSGLGVMRRFFWR